ncbi:hypothetical protein AB0878_09305 [Amycolatopsis sp. NPDC047767]|uniref:hypothetical protein n=1 Tax=Amycolatopsis sp. NPDC047767 TaxID=3156765 RepID=UPI003451B510
MTGKVYTSDAPDYTQAVFEAYAGSTKVGAAQTRTVSRYAVYKEFSFVAEDRDLVGGIDRIKVTLCVYVLSGSTVARPTRRGGPRPDHPGNAGHRGPVTGAGFSLRVSRR